MVGWRDDERLSLLQLVRSRGIGRRQYDRLMDRGRSPDEAIDLAQQLGGARFRLLARGDAEREWSATHAAGARLLFAGEPGYPAQLAAIDQAPCVLILKGHADLLARPMIAMVGARNASGGGRKLAAELAAGLGTAGYVVVSGLARGIDTAAHEAAMQSGMTTAVIASGIDVVYPPENAALTAAIAEKGLLVTERPLGAPPLAKEFPRRNRIIAGLSLGVVVVEAAVKSGSLITARFAGDQGREVMAVPGSPLDERHRGTNQLLREGAHLIETTADVMAALAPFATTPAPSARSLELPLEPPQNRAPTTANAPQHSQAQPVAVEKNTSHSNVLDELRERLSSTPLDVDELIRQCHATPAEVLRGLVELELAGDVERFPGNRVALHTG